LGHYKPLQSVSGHIGAIWIIFGVKQVVLGVLRVVLGRLMPIWVILGQVQTVWNSFRQYGQLGTVSAPFRANMSCFNAFQVVSASVGPFQAVSDRFRAFQAVLS
jgi:hypothetical protein